MRRFFPALILTTIGLIVAWLLGTREYIEVNDHLTGFPDDDRLAHLTRPYVLGGLCLIPGLAAFYYGCVGALDRYLIRSFFGAFGLCFGALFAVWFIGDLTDKASDFLRSEHALRSMGRYYMAAFPKFFVDFAPFGLLLAMLLCLGRLSRGQEIVSIIQTGRGVARLITPLVMMGFMMSLFCLGFNYRWAPTAAAFQDAIIEKAKVGSLSKVRNVVYFHGEEDDKRLWFIGRFPYNYHRGEPLRNIIIRSFTPDGQPEWYLRAESAAWDRETNAWSLMGATKWDLTSQIETAAGPQLSPSEVIDLPDPYLVSGWSETPWQLIKPGLKAEQLGIPGLYSWLDQNRESPLSNQRQFLTQWHYRFAQPGICLAIVLLAAPLGIVFSRRGAAGGIATAIFLCAGMMFCSTVFLSLGESGYLPPIWAAWGTNLLATLLALLLIQRRLVGRPIYQTLRQLLPS